MSSKFRNSMRMNGASGKNVQQQSYFGGGPERTYMGGRPVTSGMPIHSLASNKNST